MKVRVTLTVELDERDWAEAYGFDPADKALIRQDIRVDVVEIVRSHLNHGVSIPANVTEV